MNKREALNEISDLKLSGTIERMNDYQLDQYWETLDAFTASFPAQEEEIRNTLAAKDYHSYAKCLSALRDTLSAIHADAIAEECQTQMNGLTNLASIRHEKLEAFLNFSLANISVLSIDIQMAEYKIQHGEEGAEEGPAAEPPVEEIAPEEPARADSQKRILAVDDQSFYLSTLKAFLQETEYKLTCTASGSDALKFLEKNRPDLFILDIMMPEMDGYELAQKIRGAGQRAPIIFLTGSASQDSVIKAIKSGGSDFIVKPATKEQVLERISKFI
jgi:CheY-like chemotaxis protein/HPt (histidine-containing phosphotransfer) domain-containing protein